jgi:hypothetical protein
VAVLDFIADSCSHRAMTIVTTSYRYKRPPRKRKAVAIEVAAVVKAADPAKMSSDRRRNAPRPRCRQDDDRRAARPRSAPRWAGRAPGGRRPAGIGADCGGHPGGVGAAAGLSCVQFADGKLLRGQVGPLAAKHDDTIIDAGGRDSEALRVALGRSDVLLVPVQPRAVAVWSLADIAELVEQAQAARADDGRPPLRALAVLNLADPGANPDNADAVAALAHFPQLIPLDARSKAISSSPVVSWPVMMTSIGVNPPARIGTPNASVSDRSRGVALDRLNHRRDAHRGAADPPASTKEKVRPRAPGRE